VRFVKKSRTLGYDRALAEEYSITGVSELEQLWRSQAMRQLTLVDDEALPGQNERAALCDIARRY
jgi:hypothetical protein